MYNTNKQKQYNTLSNINNTVTITYSFDYDNFEQTMQQTYTNAQLMYKKLFLGELLNRDKKNYTTIIRSLNAETTTVD